MFGARLLVPKRLQSQILKLLHLGHCGIQKLKQLAQSFVYWPIIDSDVENLSITCEV